MKEPSSAPDPDEAILLRFQQDYEAADDKEAVVKDYCDRHPPLAPRIRARAALVPMLGPPEPGPAEPLPQRSGEFRFSRAICGGGPGGVQAGSRVGGVVPPALPTAARTARLVLSAQFFRSVAEAMADTAEALQHTHDAGLLHRDVKPSNLMVDRHGHCWVIDYGLA